MKHYSYPAGKPTFKLILLVLWPCLLWHISCAQQHTAFVKGFNPAECDELLKLTNAFLDTAKTNTFKGFLPGYRFVYRSGSVGLDNAWDLWIREDSTVVMMLRGTTANAKSIMADFFCAVYPARGQIVLRKADTLDYVLAKSAKAAVHGGFLIGFAFLAEDMRPKVDSLYSAGYRNFMVSGHSQGGALCYLVSAWLLNQEERYPKIRVKNLCECCSETW